MTMMGEAPKRKFARDEDLKVGDMVRVLGWKRITAIHKQRISPTAEVA